MNALSLALLPPLLELDGELGLDVGEAVHDALELVEGEAAAACHVLGLGFGFGFGFGLSFETDWLKIDGEFIQAAMTSPRDLAILKAVLSLKSVLKVKIIAEGLEDDSHVEFARSLGCEAGQGYALGRPVREPLRGF